MLSGSRLQWIRLWNAGDGRLAQMQICYISSGAGLCEFVSGFCSGLPPAYDCEAPACAVSCECPPQQSEEQVDYNAGATARAHSKTL